MTETDALGRNTFHSIAPRTDVVPVARDIRWFKHIERHGPLTSAHLVEVTSDTHRCKDSALRRLQALRGGGFLFLPKQQRACERAEFRPYVYDLAPTGLQYLSDTDLREDTVRPTGHWWHLHETAMFTARVDLAARRRGFRFIPAYQILERAGATMAIPLARQTLIPDQLFAIDYGGLFRAFMVEVDRGTEPIASAGTRKTWRSALAQYHEAFAQGRPNQHYGLKAPVQVVWVHSTPEREGAFCRLLDGLPCGDAKRHLIYRGTNVTDACSLWQH
jgi:hypothetical protein